MHRILVIATLVLVAGCSTTPSFDLQGHRGARGLAPENTLVAFERALAIGVTTLELDTGITKDGVVVITHDPTLNPAITRDAAGRWIDAPGPAIASLTLARAAKLRRGAPEARHRRTHAISPSSSRSTARASRHSLRCSSASRRSATAACASTSKRSCRRCAGDCATARRRSRKAVLDVIRRTA